MRQVVNELRGEKIDIVPFSEDRHDFVMKALQPARVKEVRIDEEAAHADVIVPDQQLSLAIGKEGQNARLASRLSGLRIDIRSEAEMAAQEAYEKAYGDDSWADGEWIVDAESGEQMWQPADGSPPLTYAEWEAESGGDSSGSDASEGAEEAEDAEGSDNPEQGEGSEAEEAAGTPDDSEAPDSDAPDDAAEDAPEDAAADGSDDEESDESVAPDTGGDAS